MRRPKGVPRALHEGAAAGERFRRGGMGGVRAPHPPEHNLIQRPELLRDLSTFLGLRQAHITPALSENVQAVVILDDLQRKKPPSRILRSGSNGPGVAIGGNGLTRDATVGVWNQSADRTVRVTRIGWRSRVAAGVLEYWVWTTGVLSAIPVGLAFGPTTDRAGGATVPSAAGSGPAYVFGSVAPFTAQYLYATGSYNDEFRDLDKFEAWLPPGTALLLSCNSVGAADGFSDAYVWWEEVPVGS